MFNGSMKAQLTEHGLQFDQAAGEVVKVDDLVVSVASDQYLVHLIVQFKASGQRQTSQVKQQKHGSIDNIVTQRLN